MSPSNKPERVTSGRPVVNETSPAESESETPMIAVWLSLGVILIGGLYGLYLGIHTGTKDKPTPQKESLLLEAPPHQLQVIARRSA